MAVADTDINIAELTENGGGGGGVLPDLVQEITYNDLKQKRDNGTLMVGVWYRITDYRATTSQEYTKAAGKRFDILALAVSANQLNEECKVAEHRGSDDFEGRDLSAWKIWYRLDNDPKFAWWCDGEMYRTQKYGYDLVMKYVGTSDEEPGYQHKFFSRLEGSYISVFAKEKSGSNIDVKIVYPTWDTTDRLNISYIGNIEGRGIVYRMIDEFDNDLPYDFQNMQFARNKIITHNVSEFVGSYAVYKDGHSYNYTVDPETEYLFTFHNCFERKKEVCKNYFPPIYRNLNSNYEAFLGGNVFVESRCNCNEIKSDWFRDNTVNFGEFIGVTSLSASISENLIKKANNLTIRGSYFSYNNILSLANLVSEFSFTNSNILGSSNIKANYTVEGITLNKNVENLIVDTNIQSAYGDILSIPANDRRNKVAYRNPADPYDRNIMIRYTDDNQGSTAKDTTYDNSKSGLNANNTQDAIDELGANLGEIDNRVNALVDVAELANVQAENVGYGSTNVGAELDSVNSAISLYQLIEPTSYERNKIIKAINTTYNSNGNGYAIFSVVGGKKYKVDCTSINNDYSGAFYYDANNRKQNLLQGVNIVYNEEIITIPSGVTTLYMNKAYGLPICRENTKASDLETELTKTQIDGGKVATNSLFVFVRGRNTILPNGEDCEHITINRHFDESNDFGIRFGNKDTTINKNFDFYGFTLTPRVGEQISKINYETEGTISRISSATTDFILPFVVTADNNADGDFPTNTTYFTGGFHGYDNKTSGNYTPTMREISKKVWCDGKLMEINSYAYCNVCKIEVVNRIQGANTEKADGSGREILEQTIRIEVTANDAKIDVELEALENVTLHQLHGFGIYQDYANYRFIGEDDGELLAKTTYKNSNGMCDSMAIIGSHEVRMSLDLNFGIGTKNKTSNLFTTNAPKGYFKLINEPLSLVAGRKLYYRGRYDLIK